MSRKVTLSQALKKAGIFRSQKELVDAVNKGRITVDGVETRALQFQFSPTQRKVSLDGKEIQFIEKKYFVINKPLHYSCQKNDRRPYVVELFDVPLPIRNSLFPVGRLDIATTGLLIVTNDGVFASSLLAPEKKIMKTYKVCTSQKITDEQVRALEQGVVIDVRNVPYQTLPAKVLRKDDHTLLLSIIEGKFRQVRLMIKAVGNQVITLERVSIGGLKIRLSEGRGKEYTEKEIKQAIFS